MLREEIQWNHIKYSIKPEKAEKEACGNNIKQLQTWLISIQIQQIINLNVNGLNTSSKRQILLKYI